MNRVPTATVPMPRSPALGSPDKPDGGISPRCVERKPPGRNGAKLVTDEATEAMLVAIVEHGGIRPAAEATKIDKDKLWRAARDNPERLRRLRDEATRAREHRTAAILNALPSDIEAARNALRAIVDNPEASPGQKGSAADSLIRMLGVVDGHVRLNEGRPTAIAETRDTTSDAELAADLDRMLRDPKVRTALAGGEP